MWRMGAHNFPQSVHIALLKPLSFHPVPDVVVAPVGVVGHKGLCVQLAYALLCFEAGATKGLMHLQIINACFDYICLVFDDFYCVVLVCCSCVAMLCF